MVKTQQVPIKLKLVSKELHDSGYDYTSWRINLLRLKKKERSHEITYTVVVSIYGMQQPIQFIIQ